MANSDDCSVRRPPLISEVQAQHTDVCNQGHIRHASFVRMGRNSKADPQEEVQISTNQANGIVSANGRHDIPRFRSRWLSPETSPLFNWAK